MEWKQLPNDIQVRIRVVVAWTLKWEKIVFKTSLCIVDIDASNDRKSFFRFDVIVRANDRSPLQNTSKKRIKQMEFYA